MKRIVGMKRLAMTGTCIRAIRIDVRDGPERVDNNQALV
jgi:hypothetical protein